MPLREGTWDACAQRRRSFFRALQDSLNRVDGRIQAQGQDQDGTAVSGTRKRMNVSGRVKIEVVVTPEDV